MFEESERRHSIREEGRIKVENIHGHILFIGAEDDVLWDTCRSIRRMEARLSEREHSCSCEALLYKFDTHFIFPESMLNI